jgi:hypothetical protein
MSSRPDQLIECAFETPSGCREGCHGSKRVPYAERSEHLADKNESDIAPRTIGTGRLSECITRELRDSHWTQLHAVTNWGNCPELLQCVRSIGEFDSRAQVRLAIRLDRKEDYRDGLRDIVNAVNCGGVWVFFTDFPTATCHPVYTFRNATRAKVILGDNAIEVPLDISVEADAEFLANVEEGLHVLYRELPGHCQRLDKDLLRSGVDLCSVSS